MINITVKMYADGLIKPFPATLWPGGYPLIYWNGYGEILCSSCATIHYDKATWGENDIKDAIVGCDVYWEGPDIYCADCDGAIESAYGDPSRDVEV